MNRRFSYGVGIIAVILGSFVVFAKKEPQHVSLSVTNRMLSLGQLSEQFQLLSQYSFGTSEECPSIFRMIIPEESQADFASGTFDLPYSKIKIQSEVNHDEAARSQVSCAGPDSNSTLTLQSGRTVSVAEFLRKHLHSSSTITLFETLVPRLELGNFWLSEPSVSPFTCERKGNGTRKSWFSERFTFVFFCEKDEVPVSFIGKVRPDGSERLVNLKLTGTIRYLIATAPQTTCIYRSVTDVERVEREKEKKGGDTSLVPTSPLKDPNDPNLNSTSECKRRCEELDRRSSSESENSNQGNSLAPWDTEVSQKYGRKRKRWLRSSRRAPYAPRPVITGESGFSSNPIHSWRSTWFWCEHQPKRYANMQWSTNFHGERACFPSSAIVESLERGPIRMDSLKVGENVRTGIDGQFSRVFMFSHKDQYAMTTFVSLHTESGLSLTLSPGHLIPVGSGNLVRADNVKVGDIVSTNSRIDDAVTRISRVRAQGLFNPHTLSGSILVNGILTSCYTSEVLPSVAHALLAPIRSTFLSQSFVSV